MTSAPCATLPHLEDGLQTRAGAAELETKGHCCWCWELTDCPGDNVGRVTLDPLWETGSACCPGRRPGHRKQLTPSPCPSPVLSTAQPASESDCQSCWGPEGGYMPQATQLEGGGSGSILPFRNGETEAWSGDGPRPRPHTLVAGWNWPRPAVLISIFTHRTQASFLQGGSVPRLKNPNDFPHSP